MEDVSDRIVRRLFAPVTETYQPLPTTDELEELFPRWEGVGVATRTEHLLVQRLRRRDDGQLGRLVFATGKMMKEPWRDLEETHPNIVQILESACTEDYHYHIFEDFSGATLAEAIETGQLTQDALANKVIPLIREAVNYARTKGLPLDTRTTAIGYNQEGKITLAPFGEQPSIGEGASLDDMVLGGDQPLVGSWIGPYRLLEMIGEGGFAEVYRAEQQTPVVRHVAIKVLKAGMESEDIVARFAAERQALARMDHPGIAQIFDGGQTSGGRPYFVMELVEGLPLSMFCQDHALKLEQRLRLFCDVCQAVEHAHGKGVIHRDLKPSNILVANKPSDTGSFAVKVIDFGIAKAMGGSKLTEKTLHTKHYQFLGSLSYISPEQIASRGDVDARSDVYALGCILYEMLAGTTPMTSKFIADTSHYAAADAIMHTDFDPPSVRNPHAHVPLALDSVTMMALEKEPERRYESAQALGEDVRRFLEHIPVLATAPTLWDKVCKLAIRHKVAASMSAVAVVSLLTATALSVWGWLRAEAAEGEAEQHLYNTRIKQCQDALENGEMRQFWETMALYAGEAGERFRGWEWDWLATQGNAAHRIIQAHETGVEALAMNPNGATFATAGTDGWVAVWEVASGECAVRLRCHVGAALCLCWSHDGTFLVTGGADHSVTVWDTAGWEKVARLAHHVSPVEAVAWHPGETRFASSSLSGTVALWGMSEGEWRRVGGCAVPATVRDLAWIGDGSLAIARGGGRSEIYHWNIGTGKVTCPYRKERICDVTVAWHPERRLMAHSYTNQRICLLPLTEGGEGYLEDVYREPAHKQTIRQLAWQPGAGALLASVGDDWVLRVWDLFNDEGKDPLRAMLPGHRGSVTGVAWTRDGEELVTCSRDGTVRFWYPKKHLVELKSPIYEGKEISGAAMDWMNDGEHLAVTYYDRGLIGLWHHSWERDPKLIRGDYIQSMTAWRPGDDDQFVVKSPEGHIILGSATEEAKVVTKDGYTTGKWNRQGTHLALLENVSRYVDVWNMDTMEATGRLEIEDPSENHVLAMGWHPNGRELTLAEHCGEVSHWRLTNEGAKRRWRMQVGEGSATAVAWSHDGEIMAVGDRFGWVSFFDSKTRALLARLHLHSAAVTTLSWSPAEPRMASTSEDRLIKLVNTVTFDLVLTYDLMSRHRLGRMAWNKQGTRLAAFNGEKVAIFDSRYDVEPLTAGDGVPVIDGVSEDEVLLEGGLALWLGKGNAKHPGIMRFASDPIDLSNGYSAATQMLARVVARRPVDPNDSGHLLASLGVSGSLMPLQFLQRYWEFDPLPLEQWDSERFAMLSLPVRTDEEADSHLKDFPLGRHAFGGIPFQVDGFVRLASVATANAGYDFPVSVSLEEPVRGSALHFLQATAYEPRSGERLEVGTHVIEYADGTIHREPVRYAEHVANAYVLSDHVLPGRMKGATTVWAARHRYPIERNKGYVMAFFHMAVANPYPDNVIERIVLESAQNHPSLIVAGVTVERKEGTP